METTESPQETSLRVAYALHTSHPDMWGWEVSGANGYGWGAEESEQEALRESMAYLQSHYM